MFQTPKKGQKSKLAKFLHHFDSNHHKDDFKQFSIDFN